MEISKDKLQLIEETVPGYFGIYRIVDGRFNSIFNSPNLNQMTGMGKEEYDRRTFIDASDTVLEEDRNYLTGLIYKCLTKKERFEATFRIINVNKGFEWVHCFGSFLGEIEGKPSLIVLFSNAILETDIYQSLLDNAGSLIYVVDIATKNILYANKKALSNRGDFISGSCNGLIKGESKVCPNCPINTIQDGQILQRDEYDDHEKKYYHFDLRCSDWCGHRSLIVFKRDTTLETKLRNELQESTRRYSAVVEAAGFGVWTYDIIHHTIISPSHSFKKFNIPDTITNVPASIMALFPQEERGRIVDLFKKIESGVDSIEEEYWMQWKKELPPKCEKVIYKIVKDGNGKPIYAYGIGYDITERKIEQLRFQQSIRKLLGLYPNALCTFYVNITKNNCYEAHGTSEFTEKLLQDRDVDGLFEAVGSIIPSQEERQDFLHIFNRANLVALFQKGQTTISHKYLRHIDEKVAHYVQTSLTLLENPETKDLEAIIYSIDVNNAEVEDRIIRTIANNEFDFLATIDTENDLISFKVMKEGCDDTVLSLSPKLNIDIPYTPDIEYAFPILDPEHYKEDIHSLSLKTIIEKLETEKLYTFPVTIIGQKSHKRMRKLYKYTYLDEKKDMIIFSRSDITEEYNLHQTELTATRTALDQAEKANELKTIFFSNASHDMRTPLNGIIGYLNLASKNNLDAQTADYLSKAKQASDILLRLINDTLDLNKLESGKRQLNKERASFCQLINSIVAAVKPSMDAKHIDFEVSLEPRNDYFVDVDILALNEIFNNLLSNALKFTNDYGKICLRVKELKCENGQVFYQVEIEDNGIGMSEEFQTRLFEPFSQERTAETARIGGSGLGLSIVKRLLEVCGGSISVKSQLKVGTLFTLILPLTLSLEQNQHFAEQEKLDFLLQSGILKGEKILLVEDNQMNQEIAINILVSHGMKVVTADNGLEAINKFQASSLNEFAEILMDIRMPVMNGFQAAQSIRQLDRQDAKEIPIIALSADVYDLDIEKSRQAGMNGHIAKPIDGNQLIALLSRLLKEREDK